MSRIQERQGLATGPVGPIPHADYCTPQCYAKGKRELSRSCECKGCNGDAHGLGKQYAFNHGYLKHSPPGSSKPKPGQEPLFPEEVLAEAVIIDQPPTKNT
jgi:hypothetical protein